MTDESRRAISALQVLIKCSCFFSQTAEVAVPAVELIIAIFKDSYEDFVQASFEFMNQILSNKYIPAEITKEKSLSVLWNVGSSAQR
jgi:hypothetical protein